MLPRELNDRSLICLICSAVIGFLMKWEQASTIIMDGKQIVLIRLIRKRLRVGMHFVIMTSTLTLFGAVTASTVAA